MFLSRVLCSDGQPALALRQGSEAALLRGPSDLAVLLADARDESALTEALLRPGVGQPVDIAERLAQGRVLLPVAGRAVLAPMTPGEEALPIRLIAPGEGLWSRPGPCTLEGGIAALHLPDASGVARMIGLAPFHMLSGGGQITLCFGPELRPGAFGPGVGGRGRLTAADGAVTEFPLPAPPPQPPELARTSLAAGSVLIRRLCRWVLRPGTAMRPVTMESRYGEMGLPLTNGFLATVPA